MKSSVYLRHRTPATKEAILRRRRYLGATVVSLIVLSLIGGTIHVITLGSNRMMDMRDRASIDLENEDEHLRAAGEEMFRQAEHEYGTEKSVGYTESLAEALLTPEQWKEVEAMVQIPGGMFVMGTNNERSDAQNRPEHRVNIPAFEIQKFPVTNAQYARFVAATEYRPPLNWKAGKVPPGKALHPVTMVSWLNAAAYTKWAGCSLPTEEQWEKAARGEKGYRWPWGDNMDPNKLNTYYNVGDTTIVGHYPAGASLYGVMDMAGNVSEWMANDFVPYKGSDAPDGVFKAKVAQIPRTGAERSMKMVEFAVTDDRYKVMRGGSWKSDPFSTSAYHRNYAWPNTASDFFGFRCVKNIPD